MRLNGVLTCILIFAASASSAQQPGSETEQARAPADLSGLWGAKKRFGPDARGRLIIERGADGLQADIAGQSVRVSQNGQKLTFELPGEQGRFEGSYDGPNTIRGLWRRPGTAVNYRPTSSPVELKAIGRGRWAGTVDPLFDEFSFYIFARPAADGSYQVALRNPEFDVGNQWGVRRLSVAGDQLRLLGSRANAPERQIAAGRLEPDLDGFSLTFPGRGGTYDFAPETDTSLAYPRPLSSRPYRYQAPLPLEDGWPVSNLRSQGLDEAAIERLVQSIAGMKMDEPDAPEIHAFLLARNGQLVLEEYFHGVSRDSLHNIRSAGKSLTATTVGAAVHAGAPLRLESKVYEVLSGGKFPAGLDTRKRAMTLQNLLTMSSGHYCDDTDDKAPGREDFIGDEQPEPDWIKYSLAVPMITDPGENSVYCSMQPNLALAMVAAATNENAVSIFDRLVARPMQISRYAWMLDPSGMPYGGGGVAIGARDFMKFGQLMLDGGKWNERTVLDGDFVRAAVTPQYHLRNIYYGYYWWIEDYPYKNRTVRAYSARGAGGNLVYVVPELDLVFATLAGNYSNRRGMQYLGNLLAKSILPAVREPGDNPNAPVAEREFVSPYGASKNGRPVEARR